MDSRSKKLILIFPPQWTPISPHFAIPSLIGQLKANNFNARALDLNIEFYNKVLKKDYIINAIEKAKAIYEILRFELKSILNPKKLINDYTFSEQISIYKYSEIKNYINNNQNYLKLIPEMIENAVKTIKSQEFYNPEFFIKSLNVIDKALDIISLPYLPNRLNFDSLNNLFFKFNYDSIKYFVFDKNSNIFIDFFNEKKEEILKEHYDFIAISINSSSQIIAGLTLANLLKVNTNAHINIGGNFFGRIADELKKHKDFFEIFADSVSIEEGEGPIVELAKFINNEISIEEVPNLMYLKSGLVMQNEKMTPVKLNDMFPVSLEDYNLSLYFSPEIVLPFQSSRGCYWGKCSFCDQGFGQNFNIKNIDKVISEMKYYKNRYNISKYEFIDESVSPLYLDELSDKMNNEKMDVKFFCDARLETAFTEEILKKAYNAGLRMIMWGLESGSEDVMKLINKGIDINKRFEILTYSKNAGIWNFAFIFFGFPTETRQDALKTVQMIVENKDIIHSYGRSVFTMGRHSKLSMDPMKYGITKIYPAEEEFSPNINFDSVGLSKAELNEILGICKTQSSIAYKTPLWMCLRYREWLFLYISKYGTKYVSEFDLKKIWGL